jgi:hypothetical protein
VLGAPPTWSDSSQGQAACFCAAWAGAADPATLRSLLSANLFAVTEIDLSIPRTGLPSRAARTLLLQRCTPGRSMLPASPSSLLERGGTPPTLGSWFQGSSWVGALDSNLLGRTGCSLPRPSKVNHLPTLRTVSRIQVGESAHTSKPTTPTA